MKNMIEHIRTDPIAYTVNAEDPQILMSRDFYVMHENSFSSDLFVVVDYMCMLIQDSYQSPISIHLFHDDVLKQHSFSPLAGGICHDRFTTLMEDIMVQIRNDVSVRYQHKVAREHIRVYSHMLGPNTHSHTISELKERLQDTERFAWTMTSSATMYQILCDFGTNYEAKNHVRFGALLCFSLFGQGQRVCVDGVMLGCFEDVFFEELENDKQDPTNAIEALSKLVHPDTVFSVLHSCKKELSSSSSISFPLSMYSYISEWRRNDDQDSPEAKEEKELRYAQARERASQILYSQEATRIMAESLEEYLPAAHKKDVLCEFFV